MPPVTKAMITSALKISRDKELCCLEYLYTVQENNYKNLAALRANAIISSTLGSQGIVPREHILESEQITDLYNLIMSLTGTKINNVVDNLGLRDSRHIRFYEYENNLSNYNNVIDDLTNSNFSKIYSKTKVIIDSVLANKDNYFGAGCEITHVVLRNTKLWIRARVTKEIITKVPPESIDSLDKRIEEVKDNLEFIKSKLKEY